MLENTIKCRFIQVKTWFYVKIQSPNRVRGRNVKLSLYTSGKLRWRNSDTHYLCIYVLFNLTTIVGEAIFGILRKDQLD